MNILGMFARQPEPGKTKSRLAATLGDKATAELYAAFVEDLIFRCDKIADQFWIAITPETSDSFDWFEDRASYEASVIPQPEGDLGKRIHWFFEEANQQQSERTVLIGSDCPDLPTQIIDSAFEQLADFDVVISPACDGGFVLIGLRATAASDFLLGINWSSAATLSETIANAEAANLSVKLLQPWYDIDTIQNLGTLMPLQKSRGAGNANCPHTREAMDNLSAEITAALKNG